MCGWFWLSIWSAATVNGTNHNGNWTSEMRLYCLPSLFLTAQCLRAREYWRAYNVNNLSGPSSIDLTLSVVINIDGAFHRVKTASSSGNALSSTAQRQRQCQWLTNKRSAGEWGDMNGVGFKDDVCALTQRDDAHWAGWLLPMLMGLGWLEKSECTDALQCLCVHVRASPAVDNCKLGKVGQWQLPPVASPPFRDTSDYSAAYCPLPPGTGVTRLRW